MHDFFCKNPADIKNKVLSAKVRHFKEDETGVDEMCELMQKLAKQERIKIAENALVEGASVAFTAKITNLPLQEVEAIAERLGKKTA